MKQRKENKKQGEIKMKTYIVKNLITNEIKGKVICSSLASAQEYFDITIPYMTQNDMLFEVK